MVITSNKKNIYLYSERHSQLLLIHPIMKNFYMLEMKGINIENQSNDNMTEFKKYFKGIPEFKIKYYLKKYLLLKKNDYFKEIDRKKIINQDIDDFTVKYNFANTPRILFEVTDSCNMKCEYCGYRKFYNNYDIRESKNLNIKIARNILNYLIPLWDSSLNSSYRNEISIGFYGGEPLINFSFIREMVNYVKTCKLRRHKFRFDITTNGVLLNKYMDFLKENNFGLLISLDGNKENNTYRIFADGKPTFDTIFGNIKLLKKMYPDYFKKYVSFNAVLHNENSIFDIYRFFWENLQKVPIISELDTLGIETNLENEFYKMYKTSWESWEQATNRKYLEKILPNKMPEYVILSDFIHQYSNNIYRDYNELRCSEDEAVNSRVPTGTCKPFTKRLFVTVNGKIFPCEKIGNKFVLGYINMNKVKIDFKKIAGKYNNFYKKMRKLCNQCHFNTGCTECMLRLNFIKNIPKCNEFKKYEHHKKYFSENISFLEKIPELYSKVLERN